MKTLISDRLARRVRRREYRETDGLEYLYASVADSPDGIALIDSEGLVVSANRAAGRILGKLASELIGRPFEFPRDVDATTRVHIVPPDQEKSVADLRVTEVEIDGKQAFLASLKDVTAQVEAEEREKLRARELDALERIAAVLVGPNNLTANCTEVLAVLAEAVQADLATVRVRDGAEQGLRLVAQGGMARTPAQPVLSSQQSVSSLALESGEAVIANDYASHPLADKSAVEMGIGSVAAFPVRSKGESKPIGVVNVVSMEPGHFTPEIVEVLNATCGTLGAMFENASLYQKIGEESAERQRIEGALTKAESRFRNLVEGSSDVLWEMDLDCVYTYCSSNVSPILGYAPDQMVGHLAYEFMPPEEGTRMRALIEEVTAAGEDFDLIEHQIVYRNGSIGLMECSGKPMRDVNGNVVGYRGVNRDISARKRQEEERRSLEVRALAHSKLATLGEVATGVAHEINQPLTYISTMIQAFQEDIQLGDFNTESAQQRLAQAMRQVDRISDIIRHLRTFGRHEISEMSPVKVQSVIDNTLLLLNDRLRSLGVTVRKEIPEGLPPVLGNESQLEQVFTNLFQNSTHALHDITAGARIEVTAALGQLEDTVEINFSDNGMGIAPAHQPRIFEPFFSTKQVGQGAGLGLSIAYGIIQDHRGTISCESEWNRGTTMTITLPVAEQTHGPS